jgi:hypothetical protein
MAGHSRHNMEVISGVPGSDPPHPHVTTGMRRAGPVDDSCSDLRPLRGRRGSARHPGRQEVPDRLGRRVGRAIQDSPEFGREVAAFAVGRTLTESEMQEVAGADLGALVASISPIAVDVFLRRAASAARPRVGSHKPIRPDWNGCAS